MNNIHKPIDKIIETINVIEREVFLHQFMIPKRDKKPMTIFGVRTPYFRYFCDEELSIKERDISGYNTKKYTHKVFTVDLQGKISWNDYILKLKKIQPEIKIENAWIISKKIITTDNKLYSVNRFRKP